MKKLMLGALAALCALLALPAFASATPAHLSSAPETFTVAGGESELTRVAGGFTTGTGVEGTGSFESTTTGKITLTFHGVKAQGLFNCTSEKEPTGTVMTTELPFHLVMLGSKDPGILITPAPGATEHFATFNCGVFVGTIVVEGNGILGTITSPECGKSAKSATVVFASNGAGVQNQLTYTGTQYNLKSSVGGSEFSQSAMKATATINLGATERELVCT